MTSAIYINENELALARKVAAQVLFDRVNTRAFMFDATNEQLDAAEQAAAEEAAMIFDRPDFLMNLLRDYDPYNPMFDIEAAVVEALQRKRQKRVR